MSPHKIRFRSLCNGLVVTFLFLLPNVLPSLLAASAQSSAALIKAVEGGDTETVRVLLDQGVDPNVVKSAEITKLLEDSGASPNKIEYTGYPALLMAANDDFFAIAKLLIEHGADVNKREEGGLETTPLMMAARHGDLPLVELLLQHKADVKLRNRLGEPPLMFAVAFGHPAVFKKLLPLDGDIQVRNNDGRNLLHFAAVRNDVAQIDYFLAKGLGVQEVSSEGATPLAFAAANNSVGAVIALLNHGADPHDMRAIALARKYQREEILGILEPDTLREKAKTWDKMVQEVFRRNQPYEIEALLRDGADPTELLQAAVDAQSPEAVRIALSSGADPLAADDAGTMPLTRAEKTKNAKVIEMLKRASVPTMPGVSPAPVARPLKVALTTFTCDDSFYTSTVASENLTALLQAQLANEAGVQWVERSQLQAAENELNLSVAGVVSPSAALRIGRWSRANLLVLGRIVTTPRQRRVLQLEVVELDHADVLAKGSVPLRSRLGWPLTTADMEIGAVAQKVRALLGQARIRRGQLEKQLCIAPLFFANVSDSHRLDFLEGELQADLADKATARGGIRILRFPRTWQAAGEAGLISAGLVEQDPVAWQKVANVYVWGQYKEAPGSGGAFTEIPVSFTLHLWDGRGNADTIVETGKVSEMSQVKTRLVNRLLDWARVVRTNTPSDKSRRQVARQLFIRAQEINGEFRRADAFRQSIQGQRLWQYRVNLLAIAHFFAPESFLIHHTWLEARWRQLNSTNEYKQRCAQLRNYADFVKRFGLFSSQDVEADLYPEGQVPAAPKPWTFHNLVQGWAQMGDLLVFGDVITGMPIKGTPRDVSSEVRDLWAKQINEEFLNQFFAGNQAAIAAGQPPILMPILLEMGNMMRPVGSLKTSQAQVKYIEDIWPFYLKTFEVPAGKPREYHPAANNPWIERNMYAELWRCLGTAGRSAEAESFAAQLKKKITLFRNNGKSIPRSDDNVRTVVAANLLPPRLKPVMKCVPFPGVTTARGIVTLTSWEGTLWISTRGGNIGANDPAWEYLTSAPVEPALWRLSPGASAPELLSSKIGKHSKITSFCVHDNQVWSTLQGDGVFCINPHTLQVTRYGGKEGVLSQDMFASAVISGQLYFGGGEQRHGRLNVVELARGTWKEQDLGGQNRSPVLNLQACGHHLLVNDRMLDTTTGGWTSLSATILGQYPYQNIPWIQIPPLQILAATRSASGLWVGSTRGLSLLNPDTGAIRNWFSGPCGYLVDIASGTNVTTVPASRLPGGVTALADDGDFLWIGTIMRFDPAFRGNGMCGRWRNGYFLLKVEPGVSWGPAYLVGEWQKMHYRGERAYVLLFHKPTARWVGYFPVTGRITSLVAAGQKLWVGLEDTGFLTEGDSLWDDKETFLPSPLLEVEKTALLSIPRDKWIGDQVEPTELTRKAQEARDAVKGLTVE